MSGIEHESIIDSPYSFSNSTMADLAELNDTDYYAVQYRKEYLTYEGDGIFESNSESMDGIVDIQKLNHTLSFDNIFEPIPKDSFYDDLSHNENRYVLGMIDPSSEFFMPLLDVDADPPSWK